MISGRTWPAAPWRCVPMQIAVGIQNKVLEAMAMGLPVVASSAAARALDPIARAWWLPMEWTPQLRP